ncbi:hypothetical protein [Neisseria animalis]|uniref:Uncharacterized protein n=1 Tax=Neisseria animalis TaxID=492 RepID=A0A5P3MQ59_NEIAN|nr:hypothetical protein [Neisseria animalis]QEY23703.1 hypothetical protein D0T90_03605 [Neisseria animalis]ROW32846.1 hypothetical protein CGZ60_03225 [Neisseria animalis]VEE09520.1 integral membrane protein [Neisseria animalis]
MPSNKIFGRYAWNENGRTGIGAAWIMTALLLPMAVWAVFMYARISGMLPPTKADWTWAAVWLLLCLPCLLVAAKYFGWKGWRLFGNTAVCLLICALLNALGGLLIALTLADWLR